MEDIGDTGDWEAFMDAMRAGRYFEAHDHLEPRWRATASPKVQAAIWLAVLLLHQARGNGVGVDRVQHKLVRRLRDAAAPAALAAAAAASPVDAAEVCRALAQAEAWVLAGGRGGPPSGGHT